MGPLANFKVPKGHKTTQLLRWADEVDKTRTGKDALHVTDFSNDLLRLKTVKKIEIHRNKSKEDVTKLLRSRSFTLSQITGVKNIERFEEGKKKEKKGKSVPKNEVKDINKPEASRPLATPDMFYKKDDQQNEDAGKSQDDEDRLSKLEIDEDDGAESDVIP